ncbi:MAG: histidine phosphatase family protein [Solirubrobacteraceae bacterium]|nr:histidine phosphatase family protein [Solirubrobacteraceae bacterium]
MSSPVLWLLRHGKAAESLGSPDAGRPLTARGEAQSEEAGETLARLGVVLAAVLTSPRVRAKHTAELAVAAHGSAPAPQIFDELGQDYDAKDLLALVSPWLDAAVGEGGSAGTEPAQDDAAPGPAVLVVGHNPTLTVVAHTLTGDERTLQTGTLVGIDLGKREVIHHVRANA